MIGKTLGEYEVVGKIGAGGMGEVYRARDPKLSRDVALKILPQAFVADSERMARFKREARTLASLNHSNIAALYDLSEDDGQPYLVMEYVDGEDLSERLDRGALPLEDDYIRLTGFLSYDVVPDGSRAIMFVQDRSAADDLSQSVVYVSDWYPSLTSAVEEAQ